MVGAKPRVLELFETTVPLSGITPDERDALARIPLVAATEFVRFAYSDLKNNPHAAAVMSDICRRGMRSEYPLSEWIAQLNRVYAWLRERDRCAKLSDIVEYVSCAFEGASTQPESTVSTYLENFGFARSVPLQESRLGQAR